MEADFGGGVLVKTESAELAGQAAAGAGTVVASAALLLAGAIEAAFPEHMPPRNAYFIALIGGVVGSILTVVAAKGWRDQVPTGFASLAFGLSLGPFLGEALLGSQPYRPILEISAILASSFVCSLIGWPLYIFLRRLLTVSGENIASIGAFLAAIAEAVSGRK